MSLLEKTRALNKILQKHGAEPVVFEDVCKLLGDVLECNVYLTSQKGKILGYGLNGGFECEVKKDILEGEKVFPENYNDKLLDVHETKANIENAGICAIDKETTCPGGHVSTIVPIIGNRKRLGTMILSRVGKEFTEEDLVLAEYSTTIVCLEILRAEQEEIEKETRKRSVVQLAIGTLSYSELEAVEYIFEELNGTEGLLVASKIADKVGITRSVIVNALRKFESAGVIESRSLGMKGTHIKILNDKLLEELHKLKNS